MIAAHLEPKGLDRNAIPEHLSQTEKRMREDAICGSCQLLAALQRTGVRP